MWTPEPTRSRTPRGPRGQGPPSDSPEGFLGRGPGVTHSAVTGGSVPHRAPRLYAREHGRPP